MFSRVIKTRKLCICVIHSIITCVEVIFFTIFRHVLIFVEFNYGFKFNKNTISEKYLKYHPIPNFTKEIVRNIIRGYHFSKIHSIKNILPLELKFNGYYLKVLHLGGKIEFINLYKYFINDL